MPTAVLLPWDDEVNITGSSNKKRKVTNAAEAKKVTADADGAIRPVEQRINIGVAEIGSTYVSNSNGEDHNGTPSSQNGIQLLQQSHVELELDIIQQMDNIEENVRLKASYTNSYTLMMKQKLKQKHDKDFFSRVDELKAYKEKHGHFDVSRKEDLSLYGFCNNVRKARQGKGNYRLDDGRIAALDATGFDWKLEAGASSTVSSNKDVFFSRVDRLRTYKEKHGHLNVSFKEDRSLYDFSRNLRLSRRAIIAGKGKIHYTLGEDRVAALDAIGFEWESAGALSTATSKDDMHHSRDGFDWKLEAVASSSMVSKDDGAKETMGSKGNSFFARLDEMKAYKKKHGRYVQIRH
jgi:hypothetical protein